MTLQYTTINSKNEIPFKFEHLRVRQFFLVYLMHVLPYDGQFWPKHVSNFPYI